MATYRLKRKSFGMLTPFAKTATNFSNAKGAFKAGNIGQGLKSGAAGLGRGAIGVGKIAGGAALGTAALGAGTFLSAEDKVNS